VVQNAAQNAFCLPVGKIVVYMGILPITQNEAGLGTVLGHEISHATSRHGAQRVFQQNAVQIAMVGIQGSMSYLDPQAQRQLLGMLGAGAQYGVLLPFSRKHELEADQIGLTYMARTGYIHSFRITSSRLKLAGFCLGGNSLKVWSHSATKATAPQFK
jgi:predicted Zn-dependent protease